VWVRYEFAKIRKRAAVRIAIKSGMGLYLWRALLGLGAVLGSVYSMPLGMGCGDLLIVVR